MYILQYVFSTCTTPLTLRLVYIYVRLDSWRCNTTVWSIPADPTTQVNVPVRQWDQNVYSFVRKVLILKSLSLIFMLWRVMYGWLSEGLVGGRDFVFEGRSRDKASSRACRAMLTPTTTLAGPNGSCLTIYTCKVWSESISEAFHRLRPNTEENVAVWPSARPSSCCHGLHHGHVMGYPPKLIPSLPGLGLPPERVRHDPMITAWVVVAASIALQSPV